MTRSEADASWHWSDYWRGARPEVLTTGPAGVRRPFEARAMWLSFFGQIPPGSRVLDLATGGGQVAGYACEAARLGERAFEVVGVDYADLPQSKGPFSLVGGVRLEQLPFEAETFDAASSQFGIEYADRRAALSELARVLKPDAPVLLLMHHEGSVITRQARTELAALQRVEGGGALIRLARQTFRAHQTNPASDKIRAAETAFRKAVGRATSRLGDEPGAMTARQYLAFMTDLSGRAGAYRPESALQSLAQAETANTAWRRRQQSQIRSALDEAAMSDFLAHARDCGLTVEEKTEAHDDHGALIGWRVTLKKTG
ncbi:MAG: class I SAM-dependent methyltransferase [Brevundimonas sp.]|uniref:class I SAM-dependent methyltransferase n=1 Tax=Brevundimonas sp. TaxID=1871086 RepID=UPI003918CCC0